MATSRTKREAIVKVLERTPVDVKGPVLRSSRNTLAPKRLQYSPESALTAETPNKKRQTTTTHNDKNRRNKQKGIKKEDVENSDVEQTSGGHGGLSSYELERLENIRQNQAFLSTINLFQATEELRQLTRPKRSQRGQIRSQAAVKEMLPPRKSLRLQNKEAETLPAEPRGTLIYEQATEELRQLTRPKRSQRGQMRSPAAVRETLPARRSRRLRNKAAETLTFLQNPARH